MPIPNHSLNPVVVEEVACDFGQQLLPRFFLLLETLHQVLFLMFAVPVLSVPVDLLVPLYLALAVAIRVLRVSVVLGSVAVFGNPLGFTALFTIFIAFFLR